VLVVVVVGRNRAVEERMEERMDERMEERMGIGQ